MSIERSLFEPLLKVRIPPPLLPSKKTDCNARAASISSVRMDPIEEVKDTNTSPERLYELVVIGVEPERYRICLEKTGLQKIEVIKAIREVTSLGLAESKRLAESAPTYLPLTFSPERAHEAK